MAAVTTGMPLPPFVHHRNHVAPFATVAEPHSPCRNNPWAPQGVAKLQAAAGPAAFERAVQHSSELLAGGDPTAALAAALAGLQRLSALRFASRAAVEPYAAAAAQLRSAVLDAANGSAAISERDVLSAQAACARSDRRLGMSPWLGHRWAAAADALLTAGFSSGDAAVRAMELWCALVAQQRKHASATHFVRYATAALGHELSEAQLRRLLAAEAALPTEFTTTLNTWVAAWQAHVLACIAAPAAPHERPAACLTGGATVAAAHAGLAWVRGE